MPISLSQATALLTQSVIDVYKEVPQVTTFFRSFFREETSPTRFLKIKTRRGFELRAKSVERGDDPNVNRADKASEKIYSPPFYAESTFLNEFDWYDTLVGMVGTVDERTFAAWRDEVLEEVLELRMKIERTYEKNAADALLSGIVNFDNGDTIDFKRKAASIQDKSGSPWTDNAVNPLDDIEEATRFIRVEGKWNGTMFDVIMGDAAFRAFRDNEKIQKIADNRRFELGALQMPARMEKGADLLATAYSSGTKKFRIWTYEQYYDDDAGNTGIRYMPSEEVIILPETPRFVFGFASPPKLLPSMNREEGLGIASDDGQFFIQENLDHRKRNHEVIIESTALPILTAVDQVVSYKVVA